MSVVALTCPKCGGKLSLDREVCEYCGTFYLVKEGRAVSLFDMPATGENLDKYIHLVNLQMNHLATATRGGMVQWKRTISKEEFERISFTARNDLREEFQREPTIGEVNARINMYLLPMKQEQAMKEATKEVLLSYLIIAVISFVTFLVFLLFILRI